MSNAIGLGPELIPFALDWQQVLESERCAAVLAERRRFGADLHDVVAGHLNCASLLLAAARQLLPRGQARTLIEAAEKGVRGCWCDARRCASNLRPQELEHRGLARALADYATVLSLASGFSVTLDVMGKVVPLSDAAEISLLRVAEEAATNAVRHAGAASVAIELAFGPAGAGVKVTDDGEGFDPAAHSNQGIGLSSMRDRADAIGGDLVILSRPGHGTQVVLTVPAIRTPDDRSLNGDKPTDRIARVGATSSI